MSACLVFQMQLSRTRVCVACAQVSIQTGTAAAWDLVADVGKSNSREDDADPVASFVDSCKAAFASLLFYPIVGHGIGRLAGPPWS